MRLIALDSLEFVRVSGPDTVKFLQGQVTCNMELLSENHSLRGALCNLQGRVIADFRALQIGDDCILQAQQGAAQLIIDTLKKYAVFSKVQLTRDESVKAYGLMPGSTEDYSQALGELPATAGQVTDSEGIKVVRIDGDVDRFELWCPDQAHGQSLLETLGARVSEESAHWLHAELAAGVVHVSPRTTEQYTPQLLNYDISGVIDFNKGCYTGQEVVARMFYRGKAKKRLFLLSSPEPFARGDSIILLDGGEDTGAEMLSNSFLEQGDQRSALALVVARVELIDQGTALATSSHPQQRLESQSLPYTSQ